MLGIGPKGKEGDTEGLGVAGAERSDDGGTLREGGKFEGGGKAEAGGILPADAACSRLGRGANFRVRDGALTGSETSGSGEWSGDNFVVIFVGLSKEMTVLEVNW